MKKNAKLGIKMKMILSISLSLLVAFSVVGAIILSSSTGALNDVSYKQAASEADSLAARIRVNSEKPLATSAALAESYAKMVKAGVTDRNVIKESLAGVYSTNTDVYKGFFTLWEPNAFDGKDAKFANAEGTDGTGRVMYWYYKSGGSPKLKTYGSGTTADYPSFYNEVKGSLTNIISEPYSTDVAGVNTRVIALASPVLVDGKFLGLVGYEVTTESIQTTIKDTAASKGIYGQWISSGGVYAAASDENLVMQAGSFSSDYKSAMAAGKTYEEKADGMYKFYLPYTLTGTGETWCISMSVPLRSQEASSIMILGLTVFGASFVLILAIIFFLASSIVKPIKKLVGHADSIANGSMDFTIDIQSKDETRLLAESFKNVQSSVQNMVGAVNKTAEDILNGNLLDRADISQYAGDYGKIMGGLNKIMDSLNKLIKDIKESAMNVASASQQISNGSQDLAQGSTEQAAAIEEINATVAEVVEQTKASSKMALTAKEISEKVHSEAQKGNDKMQQLLQALEEINTASLNISNIIKTIEDIAFQTNILALNASVEAARAGVHGKGFAVVAEEVKNLATKSADAAKETNNLINASVVKAKGGVGIGEDMRKSLAEMIEGINRAVDAISEIAEESKRQVYTIEQLNTGIEQISQVVQNNTATAEESASSSEEMSAQAELLNNMVAFYKVK